MGSKHIILILIRRQTADEVAFFVFPSEKWREKKLALPAKTTVEDELEQFTSGTSLEVFLDSVMHEKLGLPKESYVLEAELEPVEVDMVRPSSTELTNYIVCPLDVWLHPSQHEPLRAQLNGEWLTVREIKSRTTDFPVSFPKIIKQLEARDELITEETEKFLVKVPDCPSMGALARKWFAENKSGTRILTQATIRQILDAGDRALNIRVADPYLPYQRQGVGFTWSFFTHKDPQDCHVHGAPVVEIYGVLTGRLQLWSKPYYDRGSSAWTSRVLGPGDWAEVDSLQCHIVDWLSEGEAVVFKAGPGPLAEVGKLGVKGKTRCQRQGPGVENGGGDASTEVCTCVRPREVDEIVEASKDRKKYAGRFDDPGAKSWGFSVRCLIQDEAGRLLVLQRSAQSKHWPSQWDLPGGKPEPGESLVNALQRETLEESGLSVDLVKFVGSAEFESKEIRRHLVFLVMEGRLRGGQLRLSSEHAASRWVSRDELQALDVVEPIAQILQSKWHTG